MDLNGWLLDWRKGTQLINQSITRMWSENSLPWNKIRRFEQRKVFFDNCSSSKIQAAMTTFHVMSKRPKPSDQKRTSPSLTALLLGHSDSSSSPTGGLGVLAAHSQAPVVAQTAMIANLLQPLQIVTHLGLQIVGHHVGEFAVLDVALSVEKPIRDLVLARIVQHGDDFFDLEEEKPQMDGEVKAEDKKAK